MKKSSSDIEKEPFVEEEEEEALMSSGNNDHRDVEEGSKIPEKTSGGRTYVFFVRLLYYVTHTQFILYFRYTANHLTVLLKPVCITMLLTAICVVNVRTETLENSLSSGLSAYTYYDEDSGTSTDQESSSEIFGKALINSLIIIGAVIAMTFFIVALFYFRCYKTLAGFIMFTTVVALGYVVFEWIARECHLSHL